MPLRLILHLRSILVAAVGAVGATAECRLVVVAAVGGFRLHIQLPAVGLTGASLVGASLIGAAAVAWSGAGLAVAVGAVGAAVGCRLAIVAAAGGF